MLAHRAVGMLGELEFAVCRIHRAIKPQLRASYRIVDLGKINMFFWGIACWVLI
jgi:hypothetical protein